ncbi:MAG: hypothetical protein HKN82_04210 [Akkermansiaceae bacterium]|nr:hypothetical protein [Akkermansiaceae bacterium]NNM29310.1 hypothetical protein [Akkermansiaceae bacterium]
MKKLLAIAATALTGLFLMPAKAEAGHSSCHTYRSGYASCGCPTYTKRYFRGYDSCRRPIYSYVRLALSHGSSCRHRSHHSSHRYSSGHYRHVPSTYYRSYYSPRSRSYYRGGYGSRCR